MLWLFGRVLVFAAGVVCFSVAMTLLTAWRFDLVGLDAAYTAEVRAMRVMSIGEADDEMLPCERRAQFVGEWIAKRVEELRPPPSDSRTINGILQGAAKLDPGPWFHDVFKPRGLRFLPTLYLRIETYAFIYWLSLPMLILAYHLGAYYARLRTLEAGAKKEQVVNALKWVLRMLNFGLVACAGLVVFPPVAYWVVPSLLLAGLVVVAIRANHIELR